MGQREANRQPGGGRRGSGISPGRTIRSRPRWTPGSGMGDAGQQRLGVGVDRSLVDVGRRRHLHQLAGVHDGHPVRDVAHHRQVVGDEQVGQAVLVLQVLQQVDHLGPDRHVQGRHRLVGHDQLGLEGQGPGDADALALPAAEGVGVAVDEVAGQAAPLQQLPGPVVAVGQAVDQAVDVQRLADQLGHRHAGVEAGVGVLEHQLHVPPQPAQLLAADLGDVLAPEVDAAPGHLDPAQDGPAGGGLAGARLADQAQGLAGGDPEAHPADGVDHLAAPAEPVEQPPPPDRELDVEIVHRQHRA